MPTLPELPNYLPPEMLFAAAAAAAAALVAAGLLALWRIRSRHAAAAFATLTRQLTALREENGSQSATLVALAARFDALQEKLVTDARYSTGTRAGANGSAYELAIRLARGGATADELVSGCTMNRREAELTLRLHGPQNPAGTARLAGAG